MEKRTKNITLHLTEEELAALQALADKVERKPAELARILLNRATLNEWAKMQPKSEDFHRPTLDN